MRTRDIAVMLVIGGVLLTGCSNASDENEAQSAASEVGNSTGQARGLGDYSADNFRPRERRDPNAVYQVLKTNDGDYVAQGVDEEIPSGWSSVGVSGTRQECLAWIFEHRFGG